MVTMQDGVIGGLAAVAAILYLAVARLQAKRHVSQEARPALVGFILWWGGLGLIGLVTAVLRFGPALDEHGLIVYRFVFYPLVALIFVMVAGLVYYLLYLYTGRSSGLYVVGLFYALLFVLLVWLMEAHGLHFAEAGGHAGEEPGVRVHSHEPTPGWADLVLGVGLILPPFFAAIAYGLLFFRTKDLTARFRIAFVSAGFILWFGFSLLGTLSRALTGTERSFAGQVTGQLLGLLAAVLVLIAYDPPRRVRERFGIRAIDDSGHRSDHDLRSPRRVQSAQPGAATAAGRHQGAAGWASERAGSATAWVRPRPVPVADAV